jgi:hypothetical protein
VSDQLRPVPVDAIRPENAPARRVFDASVGPDLSLLDAPDLDARPDAAAVLGRLVDERVVHGLLRALAPSAQPTVDRCVVEAMDRIPQDRPGRARGRSGPARPDDRGPHRHWRLGWMGSVARALPAVALVAVTLALAQIASSTTPSADAAFNRVVKATTTAGPRRYALTVEHDADAPGQSTQRAIVDIAPRGRFLVRFGHVGRDPSNAFGFDGTSFWLVGPKGPVRISSNDRLLARRGQLGEVTDLLVVDRLLNRLGAGYRITSEPLDGDDGMVRFTAVRIVDETPKRAGSGSEGESSRDPGLVVGHGVARDPGTAGPPGRGRGHMQGWRGRGPGPQEVVFEARRDDRVVTRLDATWAPPPSGAKPLPMRIARMRFELMSDQVPPPEAAWFGHRMHHAADRDVVDEQEGRDPGPGVRD